MLEQYGLYILLVGAAIGAVGYVWLLVVAFRQRVLWGIALLFPPSALVFIARHFRKALGPLLVILAAGVVCAVPFGLNYYHRHFVKLGPHEQMVDGELRITLTKVKDFDYASLQGRREVIVLQMANADVNDQTLSYLKGMDQLRTLDLNDTGVTDEGLPILAGLPRLQELRLARTKITDEGFRKHLAPKESLLKVDLTGTDVTGKTKREWKKAGPEGREYLD